MLVIVADRWDPTAGGREQYAADLIAYLTGKGRAIAKARPAALPTEGALVLALTPVPYATHYQLHGGLAACAFTAERKSLPSSIRRALFQRALELNRRRQRLMADEAQLLEGEAALMAFSEGIARDLVDRCGVANRRVTVSRPGVDLRRFAPAASGRDRRHGEPLRLAMVAHNFVLKGLTPAIHAVARANAAGVDVTLTVAGRGSRRAFERCASRLGIGDRVRFAGLLSQAEVADLYRASDALIHPTYYDPFPRVAIEALASACPVVTTACCGAAEILTPGVDGFVVRDAEDVEGLARALAALADAATLDRMRRAALHRGRQFDAAAHFRTTSAWLFGSDASHESSALG